MKNSQRALAVLTIILLSIIMVGCTQSAVEESPEASPKNEAAQITEASESAINASADLLDDEASQIAEASEAAINASEDLLDDETSQITKNLEALFLLKAQTSKTILSFDCDDYDADGTDEAFAFVGEMLDDVNVIGYYGELWFINKSGAQMIEEAENYWDINEIHSLQ
jgi:hypothetical protein